MTRQPEMLTAALRYAAAGWPVFPCKPGSKEPATVHGFEDATTDEKTIRRWWTAVPTRNVAIPTGAPGPDVLDVDARPDGDGWAALNRLTRAGLLTGARALVRTRSGGLHVFYAGTGQRCGRLPRHHLDFKSRGGYVVTVPSYVEADENGPGGSYELLDHRAGTGTLDWGAVRTLLDDAPVTPSRPRPASRNGNADVLIRWVESCDQPNDRHGPILWAAHRLLDAGQLDDANAEALITASVRAGHAERDARRTVASVQRKAVAS